MSSTAPESRLDSPRRFLAPKDSQDERRVSWLETGPVPAPLREQAVRRLGVAALVVVGLCIAFWLLNFLTIRREAMEHMARYYKNPATRMLVPLLSLPLIVISLWLWRLTRDPGRDRRRLLDLGAVYQVLVVLVLGFIHHLHGWEGAWIYTGWSYAAFTMLCFAMIVPSTPGRMLLVASICGLCDASAFLVTLWAGAPVPPGAVIAMLLMPDLFAMIVAYFVALVVHRLGRQIERAERMGSYRLVASLGKGAMGEVWRAEHSTLARPAAIKLIRPEALGGGPMAAAGMAARFEREAQATAQLCSPHTIRVYDFGEAKDGSFYYVMELLDGIDLEQFVKRFGPMAPARVVAVLRQVCHSLAEAHARGFVHRDIKPANIFLCRYGIEVDHVKVLDFGIVKPMGAGLLKDANLTQQGQISGTPNYLSPEQARGVDAVDGRADLYAVGCVAYWLLAGRTVFDEETAMGQIIAHLSHLPTRISHHTPVPEALEVVVQRLLAKRPEDRFPDARSLDAALAAVPLADVWTQDAARAFWDTALSPAGKDATLPGSPAANGLQAMPVVSTSPAMSGANSTRAYGS